MKAALNQGYMHYQPTSTSSYLLIEAETTASKHLQKVVAVGPGVEVGIQAHTSEPIRINTACTLPGIGQQTADTAS